MSNQTFLQSSIKNASAIVSKLVILSGNFVCLIISVIKSFLSYLSFAVGHSRFTNMSISKLLGFSFIMSVLVSLTNQSGYKINCPKGMKNIHESPLAACYALVNPAKGLLTYAQAEQECKSIYTHAFPVITLEREYLKDIITFAISEGIPTGDEAGFWLGFTRDTESHLEEDGTLSEEAAAIRKNRDLYMNILRGYHG